MTDVNHFAVLNNFFAAPDDEPLRFVDANGDYVIYTNQQEIPGIMLFCVIEVDTAQNRLFSAENTKDGLLGINLADGQDVHAPNWLSLAEKLEMHATASSDYEFVRCCIALFGQVGGAPDFKDHFRLELCGNP